MMTARARHRGVPDRRRALLAVATVFGLILASCGDDDGGSSPTEPSEVTAADTSPATSGDPGTTDTTAGARESTTGGPPAGTPIKIGQIFTVQAPDSPSTTLAKDVLDAWAKWRNATGGVAGHPIEVVSKDDKADPGEGQAVARELLESENVVAFVGTQAVYTEAGWGDLMTEHHVPVVGGIAYGRVWVENPMFYLVGPDQVALLYGQMYLAKEVVGAEKVGLLLCDTANVCDAAIPVFEGFAEQVGVELSALVRGGNAAPDYAAQCLAIQQSGAEVMIIAGPPIRQVAEDCVRQGYEATFMVVDAVGLNASTAAETDALDGAVGPLSGFPVYEEFPETKPLFDAMREYYPEYFDDEQGYDLFTTGSAAAIVWSSAEAFAKAVENSGVGPADEVTSEDIIAGLAQFEGETLGGIVPPLTFGDGTEPNPQVKCFFSMQVVAGELAAPQGLTTGCQP
jgi:branched-chain amino acid transport system substrate-binding protein